MTGEHDALRDVVDGADELFELAPDAHGPDRELVVKRTAVLLVVQHGARERLARAKGRANGLAGGHWGLGPLQALQSAGLPNDVGRRKPGQRAPRPAIIRYTACGFAQKSQRQ